MTRRLQQQEDEEEVSSFNNDETIQVDWIKLSDLNHRLQMTLLSRAISIATQAHESMRDRGGMPYILHPLRLMMNASSTEEKIVAVLHDVIEDTSVTILDLKDEGFPHDLLHALNLLTHRKEVPYTKYIEEIAVNPIARAVKLLDLKDNLDLTRLTIGRDRDVDRIVKYQNAYQKLMRYAK